MRGAAAADYLFISPRRRPKLAVEDEGRRWGTRGDGGVIVTPWIPSVGEDRGRCSFPSTRSKLRRGACLSPFPTPDGRKSPLLPRPPRLMGGGAAHRRHLYALVGAGGGATGCGVQWIVLKPTTTQIKEGILRRGGGLKGGSGLVDRRQFR